MFEMKVILLERSISELVIKLDDSIENSHIGQFDGNETVNNEEEIASLVEVDDIDGDNSDNVAETSEESSEGELSEDSDSEDHVSSQSDSQERSSCDSDSEDNDCWSERQERSSSSFDSSQEGKEGSTVYSFFQNLIVKLQNIDPSYYIEQAIE